MSKDKTMHFCETIEEVTPATEELRHLLDEREIKYCDYYRSLTHFRIIPDVEDDFFTTVEETYTHRLILKVGFKSPKQAVDAIQAIVATLGSGTCHYEPVYTGFTWWDENDVEHYEEYSASDECGSASCDKCGYEMMVGDDGWFDGWDEITEWTEEDGSEHKGYVLKPRFNFCPNCGRKVVDE